MKLRDLLLFTAVIAFAAACSSGEGKKPHEYGRPSASSSDKAQADGEQEMNESGPVSRNEAVVSKPDPKEKGDETHWPVDPDGSNLRWEAGTAGVKVYSHFGRVRILEGLIEMTDEKVTGGEIVMDMTTIMPEDPNFPSDAARDKLVQHLSSEDFFNVDKHPTATFKIKSVKGLEVTGDFTINGITREKTITMRHIDLSPEGHEVHADARFVLDRTKFDLNGKHAMEGVLLSDDITIDIQLMAHKPRPKG